VRPNLKPNERTKGTSNVVMTAATTRLAEATARGVLANVTENSGGRSPNRIF